MIANTAELVAIGKIVKPFGIKGEFRVQSLSDVPGRFETLQDVTLEAPSGRTIETRVTRVRSDRAFYIIGVEAFSTPEDARVFRGGLIKIPLDRVPPLPEGRYYEFQLVGMSVIDETGGALGSLEEVLQTPGHSVFVVRGNGRERLVPATKSMIVAVDLAGRTITVRDTPEL